jgi:hypothetical protein
LCIEFAGFQFFYIGSSPNSWIPTRLGFFWWPIL